MKFQQGAAWQRGRVIPVGEASIGVTDWGLTHSDITYDVVMVIDGAFFRLEDHLDRFESSMAALRLKPAEDRDAIRHALHTIVATSGFTWSYVSMVCSRGTSEVPGTRDPRLCINHFFAWCVPYVNVIPKEVAARGAHLWVAKGVQRIDEGAVNPRIKNYHWGDFTAGLFEAYEQGADTVLLTAADGTVAEGPGFNVFAVKKGKLITPARNCLEGITRMTVLEAARETGIAVEIRDIPLDEFLEADEIFTATSGGGPISAVRVDDRTYCNGVEGSVTGQLREAYWAMTTRPNLRSPVKMETVQEQIFKL